MMITSRYADQVPIDPDKVPGEFRHLLPLAREWSIGDDAELDAYIDAATPQKKQELVDAFRPHFDALYDPACLDYRPFTRRQARFRSWQLILFSLDLMRTLMTLLIFACVFGIVSAITGIQGFHINSHNGTVVWYWHGYGRLFALVYAALFGLAFYGIYRRYPLTWRLGWVALCFSCATTLLEIWRSTRSQPDGAIILFLSLAATVAVTLYWGNWWRKQRSYFFDYGDEPT